MAGLVPAIHVFNPLDHEGVGARHKAGHDGLPSSIMIPALHDVALLLGALAGNAIDQAVFG